MDPSVSRPPVAYMPPMQGGHPGSTPQQVHTFMNSLMAQPGAPPPYMYPPQPMYPGIPGPGGSVYYAPMPAQGHVPAPAGVQPSYAQLELAWNSQFAMYLSLSLSLCIFPTRFIVLFRLFCLRVGHPRIPQVHLLLDSSLLKRTLREPRKRKNLPHRRRHLRKRRINKSNTNVLLIFWPDWGA